MKRTHPLVAPVLLLVILYGALLAFSPSEARISIIAVLIVGLAHLVMIYLVVRDAGSRLKLVYDGLPDIEGRVGRIERIPAIRRALLEQKRQELGGPDTPMPVEPLDPNL